MIGQVPEVSGARDRLLESVRHSIVTNMTRFIFKISQQMFELQFAEAQTCQIDLVFEQCGKFGIQFLLIPTCIRRDLVVSDAERVPELRLGDPERSPEVQSYRCAGPRESGRVQRSHSHASAVTA